MSNFNSVDSNNAVPPQYNGPANPNQTMTFMESIQTCFHKYSDFNGRASRAEFWWWVLFCFVVGCVCGLIADWLGSIASLALLVPNLAVSWRRLHDIGRAGGWFFIGLIPVVGTIIMIIWYVKPGEPQPNRFGPVPVK